jgi:DNA-binding IclR family transcriptional regulator
MELSSDIWNKEDSTLPHTPGPDEAAMRDARWALGVRDRQQAAEGRPVEQHRRPDTPVGVLDRAVSVLDAVESGSRSFTAIVEATGLTRPTAHRLLRSLEDHGFLFQVGGLGYALGPRLLGLASAAMRELPLRELARPARGGGPPPPPPPPRRRAPAPGPPPPPPPPPPPRPALERLARITGESTQLFIRDGDRRICVDAVESRRELRTIVDVGASLPLTKGSAGKVFLAWGPPPQGEPIDDGLAQQIATTRRRGWADSVGEREAGVASVSAPIFGPTNELLAVISVSGPASRLAALRATTYAPAVVDAAGEVAATLL